MLLDARIVVLPVQDLPRAGAWYAAVLRFAPYRTTDREILFNGGGYDLRLVRARRQRKRRTDTPAVYWRVHDLAAALGRFRQAGAVARTLVETLAPIGILATVEDPFGNLIGLVQEANATSHPCIADDSSPIRAPSLPFGCGYSARSTRTREPADSRAP